MSPAVKPIEEETLSILRRFYRINKRLPTYSEMSRIFGYRSKNAAFRLGKKLKAEGYLEKDEHGRLIPKGERLGLPLVGYVQAGFPSPAEEELIDTLSLDEYLIDKPEATFLLKVSGDSMKDAGIIEEDLVLVERGKTPRSGNIVLAHVDREWTLKYYQLRNKLVRLVAANPKYPDIIPQEELQVAGVVKAVVRRY